MKKQSDEDKDERGNSASEQCVDAAYKKRYGTTLVLRGFR